MKGKINIGYCLPREVKSGTTYIVFTNKLSIGWRNPIEIEGYTLISLEKWKDNVINNPEKHRHPSWILCLYRANRVMYEG